VPYKLLDVVIFCTKINKSDLTVGNEIYLPKYEYLRTVKIPTCNFDDSCGIEISSKISFQIFQY